MKLIEEKDCREVKERIRMMNSQNNDTEKISLNENVEKIGIDEVIKSS